MTATITPQELAQLRALGRTVELIDVRMPVEFREVQVEFAQNIPLDQLDAEAVRSQRNGSSGEPLYVICGTGRRGEQACQTLTAAGMHVVNVEGGTTAWEAAGLPVVRGAKTISLERQVRIVAGLIVLVGAVLAIAVNPYFAAIPALVGAGLMFAGITDSCGMALLLGRMPWNRVGEEANDRTCKI